MQQHSSSSQEVTTPRFAPGNNSIVQERIDAYLDRTCAPLLRSLTQEEAAQQRAEMHSHLESLVAAHTELGFSEIEAVTLALEQFGKERSVAQAWKQECEIMTVERGNGTLLSALRPVVGYSLLNFTVFLFLVEFFAYLENGRARSGGHPSEALIWVALGVFAGQFTLFPAFLGFLIGRRARGHTLATALLTIPFIVTLCGGFVTKIFNGFHPFMSAPSFSSEFPALDVALPLGLYYGFSVIGAGAALLGRKIRRRLAGNR